MIYKRYIICTLWMTICVLGMVALFNYKMDPAGIFNEEDNYVEHYAAKSVHGDILACYANYAEDRFLIKANKEMSDKDIIVLGSSRIMGLGSRGFHGSFYNLAISSALLGDDIALWACYLLHHKQPQYMIIGLDAWLMNSYGSKKGLNWFYNFGLNKIYRSDIYRSDIKGLFDNISFGKELQLFALDMTKASIDKLLKKVNNENRDERIFDAVENIECIPDNAQVIFPDGSHEWSRNMNSQKMEIVDEKSIGNVRFSSLKEETISDFSAFIEEVQRQGTIVILYLTPYHPIEYEYIIAHEEYNGVIISEAWFREFAKEHSVEIYGSFNPINMGLSSEDFVDYGHMKRASLERYFMQNLKI